VADGGRFVDGATRADLEHLVDSAVAQGASVARVDLDMAGVEYIDTFGAWLLERLLRGFAEADRRITIVGLPDRFRGLIKSSSVEP
jgi:phospholipid/cholesterol/gamma-HCH transport system permease protein